MDRLHELQRQAAALDREIREVKAATAREREAAAVVARARKNGVANLRPVHYKGEELEQITDGAAPYAVYCRRHSVVPWFIYREDGALICSCAFKKAALCVVEELNKLAAAATGKDTPVFFKPTRKKVDAARVSEEERKLAEIDERLKGHEAFLEGFELEAAVRASAVRNAGKEVA